MSPKRTCSESAGHKGPFFTVTVSALEVGRGSRKPGKERRHYRHVVGTVCRKCLRASVVKVRGSKLVRKKSRRSPAGKVAVIRTESNPPAVDIA
jgi:hypothetical protein